VFVQLGMFNSCGNKGVLEEVNRFCAFVDVSFVVFVQLGMFNSCGNKGVLEEVNRFCAFVDVSFVVFVQLECSIFVVTRECGRRLIDFVHSLM
jgi:hypothetical protein